MPHDLQDLSSSHRPLMSHLRSRRVWPKRAYRGTCRTLEESKLSMSSLYDTPVTPFAGCVTTAALSVCFLTPSCCSTSLPQRVGQAWPDLTLMMAGRRSCWRACWRRCRTRWRTTRPASCAPRRPCCAGCCRRRPAPPRWRGCRRPRGPTSACLRRCRAPARVRAGASAARVRAILRQGAAGHAAQALVHHLTSQRAAHASMCSDVHSSVQPRLTGTSAHWSTCRSWVESQRSCMPGVPGSCCRLCSADAMRASAFCNTASCTCCAPGEEESAGSQAPKADLASDALWTVGALGYEGWVCELTGALLTHASNPTLRMCAPDRARASRHACLLRPS